MSIKIHSIPSTSFPCILKLGTRTKTKTRAIEMFYNSKYQRKPASVCCICNDVDLLQIRVQSDLIPAFNQKNKPTFFLPMWVGMFLCVWEYLFIYCRLNNTGLFGKQWLNWKRKRHLHNANNNFKNTPTANSYKFMH